MTGYKTNKFFESNYVIDFKRRTVDIERLNDLWDIIEEISFDIFIKVSTFFFITKLLILFINLIISPLDIYDYMYLSDVTLLWVLLLVSVPFSILYTISNNPKLSKIQMFLEEFTYFILFWKNKNIEFTNSDRIDIDMMFYLKYKLLFYGECKNEIDTISYSKKDNLNKTLTIRFNRPVSGRVLFKYRGILRKLEVN